MAIIGRRQRVIRGVVLLGLAGWVLACGVDDGGTTEPPPPPPNRAPVTVGTIPPPTVTAGETVTFGVASYFNDPDGDALTYTVATSNAGIVSPTISGSTLTIAGVSAGTATVTVTARDPGGLTATQGTSVTVERANRAPLAVGTIPPSTVVVGETVTVTVSEYFSDPDGDALTYAAGSSDAAVASVSVSGSRVTVTGVAVGSATVTVTATDPGGLTAAQTFTVSVGTGNRAPNPVDTIPAQTVTIGDSVTVDASAYFSDPDGDALTYAAGSSDAAVASVSVSGSRVTVTGVAVGSATVTVTATDPGGLTAAQTFTVSVGTGNRAPNPVDTIPAQTVTIGDSVTVDASAYFSDPDGDALTYAAGSSDAAVASVSVSGSRVTVTGVAVGSATVTVTATDPGGLTAAQTFTVSVGTGNRAPNPVDTIPAQTVTIGDSVTVDASAYFSDPDGDALTYAAGSSDAAVASVSVSGSRVTVTGVAVGSATVTVTATDPGGLTAAQTFTVSVGTGNRAPNPVDTIPAQTVTIGDSVTVDASAYFSDPDGDALTYAAGSSDAAVASVSVSGSRVTVTGVAVGSATVTVTATDPGGLTAAQTFTVSVGTGNRAPNPVGTIPAHTINVGDSAAVDASAYFSDPDGDKLTYTAESSDAGVASVSVSGSSVTVTGVAAGSAAVTITATDPGNLVASQTFNASVGTNQDRAVLVTLYNATDGPNWRYSTNWLTDAPLDDWYGVDTDSSGRVIGLDLSGGYDFFFFGGVVQQGLKGPIPPEVGDLDKLQILDLAHNSLTGPIPTELTKLRALTHLYLNSNQLTGSIPAGLGELSNLKSLNLGGAPLEGLNRLTGSIPTALGRLKNLTYLNLSWNLLTGPIPTELASLQKLTYLILSGNLLTGPIPTELASLQKLTYLFLSTNGLTGSIPAALGNLDNLTRLSLAHNELSGQIPSELASLDNLTSLSLGFNKLDGPIPAELDGLRNLTFLSLWVNRLTGPIPARLGNLSNLKVLRLSSNPLTGTIPSELGNLAGLHTLELAGNNLTGPIPLELTELDSLETLHLGSNDLTGPLPPELGRLTQLTTLVLNDNRFSGELPVSLAGLALELFHYYNTSLCVPANDSFRTWLNSIRNHAGTGVDCVAPGILPPRTNRVRLTLAYRLPLEATNVTAASNLVGSGRNAARWTLSRQHGCYLRDPQHPGYRHLHGAGARRGRSTSLA